MCAFMSAEAPRTPGGRRPAGGAADDTPLAKPSTIDTGAIVVDMRVERISDKENGPGEILLLDADGRLQIRDVLDGEKESHQFERDLSGDTPGDSTPDTKERPKTKTPTGPDDGFDIER